jgi:poly-gamma-glutamate synthesis protein (capsule biosynthesis protein)
VLWDFAQNLQPNRRIETLMELSMERSVESRVEATAHMLHLFVCGDVMTGRGIDQILRNPGAPELYEGFMTDARDYVTLAEQVSGTIPRSVAGAYLWQEVSVEWKRRQPLVKLINLETAITASNTPWPGKGINYRMHPANIDALTSAGFDLCTLANNHVLDWGFEGLEETLQVLQAAQLQYAGAGHNLAEAMAPAIYPLDAEHRILVFAMGCQSSGITRAWAATAGRAGVYLLGDLGSQTRAQLRGHIERYRQTGDLVVISIHWGGNWGYQIPAAHQHFAHALIDEANVDLIHGHSSHHPLAVELYHGKPVLYGCGDFINDYEGIGGHATYRSDLCLMYFLQFNLQTLALDIMELLPLRIRKFQLQQVSREDSEWLLSRMTEESVRFNTRVVRALEGPTFEVKPLSLAVG